MLRIYFIWYSGRVVKYKIYNFVGLQYFLQFLLHIYPVFLPIILSVH
jgi:hypothetical protein